MTNLANADRLVVSFEEWIRTHLASSFDITDAARDLYVTRRTLERRVRNRCACSPATLVRRIRLEHAQHLRRTTELAADEIAHKVGYSTAASLRRALRTE